MKCMSWQENKEKVVNVVCALKCEANKAAAAGKAAEHLQEIKVRLDTYHLVFQFSSLYQVLQLIFVHTSWRETSPLGLVMAQTADGVAIASFLKSLSRFRHAYVLLSSMYASNYPLLHWICLVSILLDRITSFSLR